MSETGWQVADLGSFRDLEMDAGAADVAVWSGDDTSSLSGGVIILGYVAGVS